MKFSMGSSPWICFLLFILSTSVSALPYRIPRLSPIGDKVLHDVKVASSPISNDLKTFYFNQTLDHFNYVPESFSTFPQKYIINSKHWGGAASRAPIFAYLGGEAPMNGDYLNSIGFLPDNAIQFNALQVYMEHRYYGESIPFGSKAESQKNASTLGYLNSAQAIADYVAIILHIKKVFKAKYSPVIVIGGSYGGMLASWLRLKYPHVALGALASSAPILYFDNITPHNGYFSVVTKDYREISETCYETIRSSWSKLKLIASKPNGLSILSQEFKTCRPLQSYSQLDNYLGSMYVNAAQYNHPPRYPVTQICNAIDKTSRKGTVGKIAAGVFAFKGNQTCYINEPRNATEPDIAWAWQECSEIVMPLIADNDTMFPPFSFEMQSFIDECQESFGVPPRPHWITTNYGGHDIQLVLQRFGSNIIFSNGLRDPYSSGGVLHNISDTILAVSTPYGSHCLDVRKANETDPDWLVKQRQTEVNIIKGWINTYHVELMKFKQNKFYRKLEENHDM